MATQRTAAEQLQLELINRARLDPAGEAARLGIDLNEGLAAGTISNAVKQPLAGNDSLHTAAQGHSQFMINSDVFSHTGAGGTTPFQRMTNAGYSFTTAGENIALTGNNNQTVTTAELHELLFVDSGISGRGHRTNLMNSAFSEIGVGQLVGDFNFGAPGVFSSTMLTEDFGSRGKNFITGVAYNDLNANGFYDIGEGRGSITVTSLGAAGHTGSGVTQTAGGYEFEVGSGNGNTIRFSGGGLPVSVHAIVGGTGTTGNVKVDLVGTGTVLSSANTTLGSGAVNLKLLGCDNLNGVGNVAANLLTGNRGANVLNGGADAVSDRLVGLAGNDVYVINSSNDVVVEVANGGSADKVLTAVSYTLAATANIEFLQTTNNAGVAAINLAGNGIAQTITGNSGANTIYGLGGNDTLTGGLGGDVFVFNTAPNTSTNRDLITDFVAADDTIFLENTGVGLFTALAATGTLSSNLFKNVALNAVDGDDRIIYNPATGALFYDSDGNGAVVAIQFATLGSATHPTITNADFVVF